MGVDSFEKYILHAEKIGREAGGDISIWERRLSFDEGYFASQGGLVRFDVENFS